ncbi:hypothetical protein L7F22_058267 [Adiantum nelumboides]|nr:hypothetical protein [Adiantum nelumboides]
MDERERKCQSGAGDQAKPRELHEERQYGHSPVHHAVACHDYAALRSILAKHPSLPKAGEVVTEEESATAEATADKVSGIVDRHDVLDRETPLHLAVRLGDAASVEMLMAAGADWSLQNEQEWSALQEAVCAREEEGGAGAQPSEAEIAQEVAVMSQTNMYRPGIDVTQAELVPQLTWRWQEKTELVGLWKAKIFNMHHVHVSVRSRRVPGALTDEELFTAESEAQADLEDNYAELLTEEEKQQLENALSMEGLDLYEDDDVDAGSRHSIQTGGKSHFERHGDVDMDGATMSPRHD